MIIYSYVLLVVTGSGAVGDIDVAVDFPTDNSDYSHVEIRRVVGATAPDAACNNGGDDITDYTTYTDDSYTDALTISTYYSYRACVYGDDTSLLATAIVENVFSFSNYTVFLTSIEYNGNLGGISGADAKCQARAAAASLTNSASFGAILSTSGESAASRIVVNGAIYNTTGALVATSEADLWDENWSSSNLMRKTEFGGDDLRYTWTGISGGAGAIHSDNCSNWTSAQWKWKCRLA